jgi:hypothetical protein
MTTNLKNMETRQQVVKLLDDFMHTKAGENMLKFANYNLDTYSNTHAFAILVKTAQAIVDLSNGEFDSAYQVWHCYAKYLTDHVFTRNDW